MINKCNILVIYIPPLLLFIFIWILPWQKNFLGPTTLSTLTALVLLNFIGVALIPTASMVSDDIVYNKLLLCRKI